MVRFVTLGGRPAPPPPRAGLWGRPRCFWGIDGKRTARLGLIRTQARTSAGDFNANLYYRKKKSVLGKNKDLLFDTMYEKSGIGGASPIQCGQMVDSLG